MNKKLLLNGCSFGKCWPLSKSFIDTLGCSAGINISKIATGFQRTCRSTIEWIAQNGDPGFVIIPITFSHRIEIPAAECDKFDDIDGNWIPVQQDGTIPSDAHDRRRNIVPRVEQEQMKRLFQTYHKLVNNTAGYVDKIFTEIILLSAFLESRNIPYLMFDMCNDFDEKMVFRHPYINKFKLLKENNKLVKIFEFCGNKYMQSLIDPNSTHFNNHHAPEQYLELEKYLIDYMKQNNLIV